MLSNKSDKKLGVALSEVAELAGGGVDAAEDANHSSKWEFSGRVSHWILWTMS